MSSDSEKICLITGGNAGIGKAAALALAKRGAHVVIAARSQERGERALADLRVASSSEAVSMVTMDLSSRASIAAGCRDLLARYSRLDVLIHNAADFDLTAREPRYTDDDVEAIWATNHVGPVLVTQELEPALAASEQARVITVASKGLLAHPMLHIRLEDPEFRSGGYRVTRAYYQSKLAQVMYTYWLARRWADSKRIACCVRVTNVKVDLARYPGLSAFSKRLYGMKSRFALEPEQMAETYVWLALSPEVASQSGGYFDEQHKQVSSSRYSRDPDNITKLMELTARYVPGLLVSPA